MVNLEMARRILGFNLLCLITVTKLSAQTFSVLHYFTNFAEGTYPVGGLIADGNTLYGTTRISVFKINANGSGYTVLQHLPNSNEALLGTTGPLLLCGTNLYGIASQRGSNLLGTIFRISTNGTGLTVLRDFTGAPDGSSSYYSGLALSSNTLYGVTRSGGSNGFGTVFKIRTDGSGYSIIRHFEGSPDGDGPSGTLVLDGNTLYGETGGGGSNGPDAGTVFKLDTDGSGYSILRHFGAFAGDAASLVGSLILRGDTLFGTSGAGGSNDIGTVFKIKTNGMEFAVLHNFTNSPSGSRPWPGVILVGDTLYGTTATVAGSDNGTVFSLKTDGAAFTTIKSFSAFANVTYPTNSDGASPQAGLLAIGNMLYGAASSGGLYADVGRGTLFKIKLPESLRILADDAAFGIQSNVFGFNVIGNSNQTIVIEACANLANLDWVTLQTNRLGEGPLYFNDPGWTNSAGRFYRVRSP